MPAPSTRVRRDPRRARLAFLALAALLALLAAGAPPALHAQRPLRATGVRGIDFGTVLPGIAQPVLRTDATRSAEFDLTGPNRSMVQITFVLPTALTAAGGGSLPVVFGVTSAGYSQSGTIGNQTPFDPAQAFTAALGNTGRGSVFLGATLHPSVATPAGAYTAPITITLALLGT